MLGQNLHSTLVLLKEQKTLFKILSGALFTFYSSSIKGAIVRSYVILILAFTFYSSSIKG